MKIYSYLLFFLLLINNLFSQDVLKNNQEANKLFELASNNFFNLNNKESIKQAEKILTFALENNDNNLAAKTYNLLGLNFEQFTDHKKAITLYKKGIFCATKVKNDTVLGWLYNNIGGVYSYNYIDLNVGTSYFKKAYQHTKNIDNNGDFLVAGLNIGGNLIDLKQYEEGKKYLDEIKDKVLNSKEIDIVVAMFASYATYYDVYKNDFSLAEKAFLDAIYYGKKDKTPAIKMNLLDIYKSFAAFYEKHNKLALSVKYLNLYIDLNAEIYNEEQKNILNGKDKNFRLDLVNSRIEKVEQENKDYIKKLNYNKYFIIFLTVLVFTFLTLMYFLYKNFIKNKKINRKLKRANIELHKAKQKTEEIAKLKTQFMSTVSHELRTPLYGVIGMTEIIENEHAELKDSKYLNSLKFSAKYLLSLINDVLSLSKIESEKIELNYESIDFRKEIETIVSSMEVIANQYHNKVKVDVSEHVPTFIKTDKTRLSQIIINLLSNALKFTKDGTVSIFIFVNESKKTLKFEIKDTGIGIPQKYIDKIFDKFIQVERNSDEQFQGTGLGLAIVKRFIDIFNGEIHINSEINVGTTITFSIPLILGETIETAPIHSSKDISNNISILVVEDNKVNQIVTQKLLEKNNLKCKIAVDGYQALEILKSETFDIILMDIHMPGINGFETTEKIHELGIKTPIIALTASDKYEIEGDISKYKMNDLLVKPFEFIDLQNLIIKYINKT
ncbi:ATP-binding protein [Flavobacterium difficile]|uniref:histidine kinase n=1 Tax=Flavobacterium difficile TaxID=2709659 RepID=A0ABX0I6P6_9FLAO|nr:ATP-binding protein [Flavobacterium difficile]NHM02859.1 response regulator [Flavobacterium difficile]